MLYKSISGGCSLLKRVKCHPIFYSFYRYVRVDIANLALFSRSFSFYLCPLSRLFQFLFYSSYHFNLLETISSWSPISLLSPFLHTFQDCPPSPPPSSVDASDGRKKEIVKCDLISPASNSADDAGKTRKTSKKGTTPKNIFHVHGVYEI